MEFFHENRIMVAANALGAAVAFCHTTGTFTGGRHLEQPIAKFQ